VLWKDKSMSWVKLKDLKASNPVELQSMQWQIRLQKNQYLNGGYLTLCISRIVLS
jgi:hypothetical protein